MRLRKYCEEHDSLFEWDDLCQTAASEKEQAGIVSHISECRFIVVELVNRPDWVRPT